MKKHVFAWEDDEGIKLPEIKEEAPEIKDNVLSFEDAIDQIRKEETKILETAKEVVPIELIKDFKEQASYGDVPSEYSKVLSKKNLDSSSSAGHIVVLVHSFYKEAAEEAGTTMEKTDAVYEWYLQTIRESMVEEENLMKITLVGLGSFQVSIRCILGTLYKRMAYSEKMFNEILEQNHRNIHFKQRALKRVLIPTNLAYRKGKEKFDLLGHFPEFNNRMFKKTEEFFYIIATKLPKLYERLSRVR